MCVMDGPEPPDPADAEPEANAEQERPNPAESEDSRIKRRRQGTRALTVALNSGDNSPGSSGGNLKI